MAIKESSDELNPPEMAIESAVPVPQAARSPKDYLALTIATCGVGYIPLAPGTFGSLVGIGLFLLLQLLTSQFLWQVSAPDGYLLYPMPTFLAGQLMLVTIVVLVGIWAGSGAERLLGRKDPQKVVIDEVAGQLIALIPVTPRLGLIWWLSILISFLLFRFFDIVKPYPARQLEMLPAGLGIMADDMVAGAYAAVATSIIIATLLISVT